MDDLQKQITKKGCEAVGMKAITLLRRDTSFIDSVLNDQLPTDRAIEAIASMRFQLVVLEKLLGIREELI